MPRVCVVAAQVLGVRWACVMMFSSRNRHFAASPHGTTLRSRADSFRHVTRAGAQIQRNMEPG